MSLILDALNRADRERSEQRQTPNVHAAPLPIAPSPTPVLRWLVEGLLVITLIAGVAYLFFFQQQDEQKSVTVEKVPAPASQATAPARTQKTTVTQASKPYENTSLPEPLPKNSVDTPVSQKTEAPSAPENAAIAQLYRKTTKTIADITSHPAAPTEQSSTPAPPSQERAKPSAQDILQQIPLLTSLSSRFQQSIPNVDYSAHLYNDQEGSGVVKLNGALRKIGSEPAPGLRVIAILPDSVVLSYNGIQFRLIALNSWINYN